METRNEYPKTKTTLSDSSNASILNINEDDVEQHERLGTGSSSAVFRGTWNNKNVAIKLLTDKEKIYFNNEKEIMSRIAQHAKSSFYCVNLFGCIEANKFFALVMEYFPKGNLTDYIQNTDLDLKTKHKISFDITCGLKYLHKNNIIHRDIKTDNIMIDTDRAVIIDFGISIMDGKNIKVMAGTPASMAPEIIDGEKYSEKSDMYAFAILLFSLYTGQLNPYPLFENGFALMFNVAQFQIRPTIPANTIPENITDLMIRAWSQDIEIRPSAKSAGKELTEMLKAQEKNTTQEKIVTLYYALKNNSIFLPKKVIDTIAEKMDDLAMKRSML